MTASLARQIARCHADFRTTATPGTEVIVTGGEHPGSGTDPDADLGFPKIRATVAPAPYDAHARTLYRRH